eukprot:m.7983 g.7983  ORF g.7983 m.7983 type:complete len:160 (+) comp3087_c0_seq1:3652-4131(+)
MVKLALQFKANLEYVDDLLAAGDDFRWYVSLLCTQCDTVSGPVYVVATEVNDIPGGRGQANLVGKCKFCSRQHSVSIVEQSVKPYKLENNNQFQTIVEFEARGVDLQNFDPRVGWTAKGAESGTKFDEIDLGEKEWVDYDEKANESVGIYEVEAQFVKA